MKKKLLAILLAVCMVISMAPAALAADSAFADVNAGDWFADEVKYVYGNRLMEGVSADSFNPDGTVTRAMVWTTLARLDGVDTTGSNPWWLAGQQWAMKNEISDGTMAEENITREQLVTMFWRYANYIGADVTVGEITNILSYADAFDINDWAYSAMQWACGVGIINGTDGKLMPQGDATRAQLAAILYRFAEEVVPGESEREEELSGYDPSLVHHHSFKNWVLSGDGVHTGTCSCGVSSKENCTLDADNICTKCGAAYPESASDLQAALNAGGYVKLTEDVTADATLVIPEGVIVTLDLNGKALTGSILAADAALTIQNGSLANTDPNTSAIEINAGTLVLDNVNIDSARHAVRIDGDVTATISGGTYRSAIGEGTGTYHAVNVSGAATVTIEDGTFVGPKGTVADSGSAVKVQSGATVAIEGGSFSGGKNSTLSSDGTLTVTGGAYDQDPKAFLADSNVYKAVSNDDGTWTVEARDVIDGIIYDDTTLFVVPADFEGTTVNVAEGTTTIGGYAFASNNNIETIVLPSTVTTLNDRAFRDTSASTVVLNEGLTNISYQAFRNATNVTSVEIPSTVTTISKEAFQNSGIQELTIPATVETLEYGACRDMKELETVTIEGNVEIPVYAFRACTKLRTVYLMGDDVTFAGRGMIFTNKENDDGSAITVYVANETVKQRLLDADTAAKDYGGYTIIVANEVAEGVIKHADSKTYEITSAEGLVNLNDVLAAASLGEGVGAVVNLTTDIDLTGETWLPIEKMWVTFNGNGHTISNLTAGFDSTGRRSGFWGYAGAVTINDLTIENANITGSQAGIFAGSAEGFKVNNCVVKGTNTVTFAAGVEEWNGIGAITGVLTSSNVNVTIAEGATVTLEKGSMTTAEGCVYVDNLTGYLSANEGTVTNNGTVTVNATPATAGALDTALKNGDNVVMTEDMTFSASDTTANSGYGATGVEVAGGVFDGEGNTLTVNDANGT